MGYLQEEIEADWTALQAEVAMAEDAAAAATAGSAAMAEKAYNTAVELLAEYGLQ